MKRLGLSNSVKIKSSGASLGFTLIEFLVAIALALFLLLGLVTVFESTIRGSTGNLRSAKLNQELSAVLQMMVNDIRRAGYTNGNNDLYKDLTTNQRDVLDISLPSSSCVLYSFDQNRNGAIDNDEQHGFKRVESDGVGWIEFGTNVTSCTGDWPNSDLTNPDVVNVTALEFSTTGSKCKNETNSNYWLADPATEPYTNFPCDLNGADSDVWFYEFDAVNGSYLSRVRLNADPVADGENTVETRQVNIRLVGQLVQDDAVEKEVAAAVKVRNDFSRTH